MSPIARASLCVSLSASLAACASTDETYPSLAIRDVERAQGQFEPVQTAQLDVPEVKIDLTGGLDARLASLVAAAQNAQSSFEEVRPRATRLVSAARRSAVGSDAWASAQVALAELDTARSLAAVPLADLEAILVAQRVAADDVAAVTGARDQVLALVARQDAVLADLRAQVR